MEISKIKLKEEVVAKSDDETSLSIACSDHVIEFVAEIGTPLCFDDSSNNDGEHVLDICSDDDSNNVDEEVLLHENGELLDVSQALNVQIEERNEHELVDRMVEEVEKKHEANLEVQEENNSTSKELILSNIAFPSYVINMGVEVIEETCELFPLTRKKNF